MTPDQGLKKMGCVPVMSVGVQEEEPHAFKCAILMPVRKLIKENPGFRERLKAGLCKAIDEVVDAPMDDMTLMGGE